MKDWELAQQRAQLYERLCQLTDSLLDLTITWWQTDPELGFQRPSEARQLELPLADRELPDGD